MLTLLRESNDWDFANDSLISVWNALYVDMIHGDSSVPYYKLWLPTCSSLQRNQGLRTLTNCLCIYCIWFSGTIRAHLHAILDALLLYLCTAHYLFR